jgi:hypothetical protein
MHEDGTNAKVPDPFREKHLSELVAVRVVGPIELALLLLC